VTLAYEGGAEFQAVHALKAESDDGHLEIDLRVSARSPFELGGPRRLRAGARAMSGLRTRRCRAASRATAVVEAVASARGARAHGHRADPPLSSRCGSRNSS
jgi:hypothetical protein